MTSVDVNDVLKRTQSTANGSTTDFSFSFQVNNTNEIKVYEDSTLKTEGTHYDIVDSSAASGLNANGTGVVKFKTSPTDYTPANNKVITILSVMSIARASVYTSGGNITAASLEADFDKLHRVVGDFREVKSRTLIAPEYSPTDIDMTIPSKASRLGKILGFNSSTGNPEMFTYLINDNVTALDGLTAGTVLASKYVLVDANKDITGFRNITLSGELDAGSLDVSGDADIDGTLEADAITIGGVTLAETISDTVGAMVSSNTETGITVTYEDGDNTLDFVIGSTSITNAMLAGSIADSKLNTITTAGKVAIGALEIDGASDIGADLADADLIIVDDGAGGTEVKSELTRIKKYIYSSLSGDATTSDSGALTIANDAVESGMLNDNIISGQTAITSGLASTDELLFSDAGTIKRMDVSVLTDYYKDLTVTETNKTLTSPVLNTGVSGTAILDEDDLSTNSATQLATQQSIKAYVDAQTLSLIDEDNMSTDSASRPPSQQSVKAYIATQIATKDNSDEITEGSSNLYFTNARADARITNALIDEDDMSTNSATKIPSQQSVKAYVDAQKADMQFVLEDGDGTEVQITKDKEVKFVEGGGIDINWTDTSTGSDADPFDLTFTINAAQTDITSLLATDIKIGEDDQTKIDFETADTINFYAGNEKQIILTDGALTPGSNAIVDLGSSSLQFKDGYFDGTVEADAITIGGTTLAETISDTVGAMVGGNTETGITVTYEDSNNTLDFVIGAGSIVNSMLADDAVGADELASNAVVNASVASGAAIVDTKLATISTANKVALTALDIDGGADIGAAIVDADLFIIDDGGGGTNKKVAASRIKTYISAATSPTAADDIGEGDAAVTIATSTGNITLDAQGSDTDIIFKGTDGSSDTTFLTIDGSAAGAATFNDKIIATELDISGDIDVDGTANLDVVDIDGAVDMASTLTIGGALSLTGGDDGDTLLVFNTDRTWQFQQNGDDGSTSLGLKANTDSKSFTIQNSNGDIDFNFFTSHSGTPNFTLGKDAVLRFEGSSDDANETTLTVTDPTADRTITLPNATGTVITTGNTSDITSTGTLTGLAVNGTVTANDITLNTGANSLIKLQDSTGAEVYQIKANVSDSADFGLLFEDGDGNDIAKFLDNGECLLTHNHQTRLQTTSAGVAITGSLDMNGGEVILDADADTSITADTDDVIDFKIGGTDRIKFTAAGGIQTTPSSGGNTIINEGGVDADFRIESDNDAYAFFLNGANGHIGIGSNNADYMGSSNTGGVLSLTVPSGGYSVFELVAEGADSADALAGTIAFHNTLQTGGSQIVNVRGTTEGTTSADRGGRFTVGTKSDGGSSPTERFRIASDGRATMTTAVTGNSALYAINSVGSGNPAGIRVFYSGYAPDDHDQYIFIHTDTGASRFLVHNDGDVQNHDNSYGAISDERIKQNIVDSNSQWDDIKAIKVRNFKRKDDVAQYGDKAWSQIGVVAQEVEAVCPKIIREANPTPEDIKMSAEFGTLYTKDDSETQDAILYTSNDIDVKNGEKNVGDIKSPSTKQIGDVKEIKSKVKSIGYSVLYMKAVKALQEAMTRIETLEAKVKVLEEA